MADEIKQVIVVRKDLKMRKGKLAAQVAHASMKILLDRATQGTQRVTVPNPGSSVVKTKKVPCLTIQLGNPALAKWVKGKFTKVVVGCKDEAELLDLADESKKYGFPTAVITDSGATEFHGVPTKTCVAIGPAASRTVDELTGHLKLL